MPFTTTVFAIKLPVKVLALTFAYLNEGSVITMLLFGDTSGVYPSKNIHCFSDASLIRPV